MTTFKTLTLAAVMAGVALPASVQAGDDDLNRLLFRILQGNAGHHLLQDGHGGYRHAVRIYRDDDDDDGFRRGGRGHGRDDDDDDGGRRGWNDDDD